MNWTWVSLEIYIGDTQFYTTAIARGGGEILKKELATSMDYVQSSNRGQKSAMDKTLKGCTGVLKKMCNLLENVIKKIKKLTKEPKLAVQVYNDLNFIRYSISGGIDKDIKHNWKRQTIRNDPEMLDKFLSQLDAFLQTTDLEKTFPTELLPARYISKGEEKRLCKQAKSYMLHTYKTKQKLKFSGCDEKYNKKTKEMMDYYKNNKKILKRVWDEPSSYDPELLKEMKAWVKKQNKLIQDTQRAERLERRQSSRLKF